MEKNSATTALMPLCDPSVPKSQMVKAELLPHPKSRLETTDMKQHPILDSSIPYRALTDVTTKKESISLIIDKLDVANNLRYQRTVEDTYCNVYSYDYCYFCKVYLPTVWWTDEALEKIKQGQEVEAVFEKTVERIYSSAIHDWFSQWGSHFGWQKMDTVDALQNKVNANGGVGIICAKRKQKGLSGHIVPVVPETAKHQAFRKNGKVLYPLQSQAGKVNYNYFSLIRKDWWKDDLYSSYVLYYHE
jgi:hypothetical protein